MINEQLEFQISQYADGTLPAEDAAALEQVLAGDEQASALLDEYRSIAAALKPELALPALNWDRLAEHLSDQVARADEALAPAPIPLYARLRPILSMAASLMIGFGLAAWIYRERPSQPHPVHPEMATNTSVASRGIEVTGPSIELTSAPRVAQITVDASPLAKQITAADAIVFRPPRIVIASSATARQNGQRLPY
jgi:anti-sigma factor RsiW